MENLHRNMHVFVLSCENLHESTKHALFMYFLHLVPPFIPHYIIMVKGTSILHNYASFIRTNRTPKCKDFRDASEH